MKPFYSSHALRGNSSRNAPALRTGKATSYHASYANTLGLRKALFSALPENCAIEAAKRYRKTLERKR